MIGGQDKSQNDLILKHYLEKGDICVHVDSIGGSYVVVKNYTESPIPTRTIYEAGSMAVCYRYRFSTWLLQVYWVVIKY